jgi:hypothetical protein
MITWSAAVGFADDENVCWLCNKPALGRDRLCRRCEESLIASGDLGDRDLAEPVDPWADAYRAGGGA